MAVSYTERTLRAWAWPLPTLLPRLTEAAAVAVADPTPENVDYFDTLAHIAEQKAAGGKFGTPVLLTP